MTLRHIIGRIIHFAVVPSIFLVWSCANPVAPTGGPKDETPPVVLSSEPLNRSVNFTGKEIRLTFDEFVQVKNTNEQVVISPPFKKNPEYQIRGKSVVIRFDDTLKSHTTYTLFFGESISDITESNPLVNYWCVFSTGPVIDSLSLKGTVRNAFTLMPEENVLVMLYEPAGDSVPYKERPFYVSRSNKEGQFRFYNLRNQPLQLFALKESNGNYLYDAVNEWIAFSDTLVLPYYIPETAVIDLSDSVIAAPPPTPSPELMLSLFQEVDSVQRLLECKLLQEGIIRVVFRFPAGETVIRALNDSIPDGWNLTEWNRRADTALLWLTPGVPDTLWLEISDSEQIFDTLRILTTPIVPASKSKKAQEPVKKLNIASNIRSGQLDPFKPFILTFGNPVSRYSFSGIVLMTETDTLAPAAAFTDSTNRMMEITYPWKESGKCSIIIPDSIFFGLDGTSHDSLTFYFTIRSLDSYGNITLNVSHSDTTSGYIIQLVTEKDAVVREYFTGQSAGERIDFSNLDPGKYRLKAIYDRNRNHRWDTGKYLMHLAPEKVAYFDKTLEIRANWISEESWILE